MDSYFNLISNTIDYIEDNLDGDLGMETLAARASISKFHFHRIFTAVAGIGLAEYVSKRRLSQAAQKLRSGNDSVLQISLGAGFNSPESFARAFKKNFGLPPRTYRSGTAEIALFEKISLVERDFKNMNSSVTVDFELVELPETVYVGKNHIINLNNENISQLIMGEAIKFTDSTETMPSIEKNISLSSLVLDSNFEKGRISVFWSRAVKGDTKPEPGYQIKRLPPSTYAVFRYTGLMVNIRDIVLNDFIRWMAVTKMELNDIGVEFIIKHPVDYREKRELLIYLPIKQ